MTESQRIAALQRFEHPTLEGDFDRLYRKPGARPDAALRYVQRLALHHLRQFKGLIAPIGCGYGKGLISFLAATAAGARRPLLLVPASMLKSGSLERERAKFSRDWRITPRLQIKSYDALSRAGANRFLEDYQPDLIICDEAHKLRHWTSSRTKRVARYMDARPQTMFAALSGTFTSRSLKDYAHLAEWALGDRSHLPREYKALEAFCDVLDRERVGGKPPKHASFGYLRPLGYSPRMTREEAQEKWGDFQQHLAGVVVTGDASVDASLAFDLRAPVIPDVIASALAELQATWTRPDGERLPDPMHAARVASYVRAGFYYRWIWPDGKPDVEWMNRRSEWHGCAREICKMNLAEFDSALLVAQGLESGALDIPHALEALQRWHEVKDRWVPHPPIETIWLDDYLIQDALQWAVDTIEAGDRGVIWYSHTAVGDALAEAGLQVFGAGTDPEGADDPVIACSLWAHTEGKNLQHKWRSQLFTSWSPNGQVMEQAIARTHRSGQREDLVDVYGYAHDSKQIASSYIDAGYIERTTCAAQRLRFGEQSDRFAEALAQHKALP